MAAPMVKTDTPGVFRRGSRYVVVYRDGAGRQRKESARTITEAKKVKAARQTDVERGEFDLRSRVTFREYALEWIERYQGTGRRGFREETRDEWRRLVRDTAVPFLGRKRVTQLTPKDVADYIGWLCDGRAQAVHAHELATDRARERGARPPAPLAPDARRELADSTVRNALTPVRSCLATAKREGLIRHNPATDAALPHRPRIEDDDGERVRPFPRVEDGDGETVETMELVVQLDPDNLHERVLRPACSEAGVEWAGFHTFRHTVASRMFAQGRNVKQVQRWLGHHSPSFTLDTYVHLLDGDLGEPLALDAPPGESILGSLPDGQAQEDRQGRAQARAA